MKRSPPAPKGLFITGTDTGSGKTIVTAALAAALALKLHTNAAQETPKKSPTLRVIKPVMSGSNHNPPPPPPPSLADSEDLSTLADDALLWTAGGQSGPWNQVCVHHFGPATAPSVAQELDPNTAPLDFSALAQRMSATCKNPANYCLVEGVGGWRVWLDAHHSVRDLARATGFAIMVVAGNRLGAINHSVLTVEAILNDGFEIAALVLNHGAYAAEPAEQTARANNAAELRKRLPCPVLEFARLPKVDRAALQTSGAALLCSPFITKFVPT